MTDNLSNNIPTPFTPSGNPSVLPDSPPPSEVAVDPIPPLPSMSPSAANPPSKFDDTSEPKVETVIEPDPPKPVEKPVTPPIPPPPSVPEENPAIRQPGAQSAVGDKSGDPYVKKHPSLPKVTIAGIASLVFLVVALGSGLYLTRQKQEVRVGACYGPWDCGGNSYCAGAVDGKPGSCAEGGNRNRTLEEIVHDYQAGGGETNDGRTAAGAGQISEDRLEKLSEVYPTAVPNPPPGQDASLPQPTDSPAGSSCNDCGGFNQGRCEGPGFAGCGSSCDPGLSAIAGGCYPPDYHECQGKGVFPPETSCDANDPCAGVTCTSGQYCNGGACVTQKTTAGAGKAIVSFSCSSCSADRRCDSSPQVNSSGYGKACGQVDECPSANGVIDYSRCNAIKLCDSSCSGGLISGTNGGGGPTSPPGGPTEPPVPTTPATISANCQSLVAQISNGSGGWTTKTDADFAASVRPGDGVRFVCTGHKTQGAFTKAAFFINGTLHVDDVVKLNADQYAVEYTIPAAGSLEVESVLLHDSKGWVD